MPSGDKEVRRLQTDKANQEAMADAIRESSPKEADRQDNEAKGLKAEIDSGKGNDPGKART